MNDDKCPICLSGKMNLSLSGAVEQNGITVKIET